MTYAEKPHILVVDDDDRLRDLLFRTLTRADMVVVVAEHAAAARAQLAIMEFDLIVLDVMMPEETGLELTAALRKDGNEIPILLLTALGAGADRIGGLTSGADDYLVKPFEPQELILRINAILRRQPKATTTPTRFQLGEWMIDLAREEIARSKGTPQRLTIVERNLLRALVVKIGEAQSRDTLARACGVNPDERTIDVQMTRLRRRLGDDPKQPRFIATVRGQGYRLLPDHLIILG
jgi:two-component system phosphate regulon response regulator OmpR